MAPGFLRMSPSCFPLCQVTRQAQMLLARMTLRGLYSETAIPLLLLTYLVFLMEIPIHRLPHAKSPSFRSAGPARLRSRAPWFTVTHRLAFSLLVLLSCTQHMSHGLYRNRWRALSLDVMA
jgi:hypothetical protein